MTIPNKNEICANCGHTKEEHFGYYSFCESNFNDVERSRKFVPKNQSNNQHNTTEKGHYKSDAPVSHKPSLKSDTEDTFGSADRKTELSESGSRIEDGSVPNQDEAILKEVEKLRLDFDSAIHFGRKDDYNQIYGEKDLENQYNKGFLAGQEEAQKEFLEKIEKVRLRFTPITDCSFSSFMELRDGIIEELKNQIQKEELEEII